MSIHLVSLSHQEASISHLSFSIRGQTDENNNHRKLTNLITWTTALSNSMKLWAMACRATTDGQVMVERSDKTQSTGEGNGKLHQYSCLENHMNTMKRQKDMTMNDELPMSAGAPNTRNNEESQSKNNIQLWMWRVMETKPDAVKSNIA